MPNLITCEAPTTQESRGSPDACQVEMSTLLRLDRLVFPEKPSVLKGFRPHLQWGSNRPPPEYRRGAQSKVSIDTFVQLFRLRASGLIASVYHIGINRRCRQF